MSIACPYMCVVRSAYHRTPSNMGHGYLGVVRVVVVAVRLNNYLRDDLFSIPVSAHLDLAGLNVDYIHGDYYHLKNNCKLWHSK